jgi:hypothetical protein
MQYGGGLESGADLTSDLLTQRKEGRYLYDHDLARDYDEYKQC